MNDTIAMCICESSLTCTRLGIWKFRDTGEQALNQSEAYVSHTCAHSVAVKITCHILMTQLKIKFLKLVF